MPLFSGEMTGLAHSTVAALRAAGHRAVTAESCTGGLIAGLLTEVPGASDVLGRGFIVYSNQAKTELLGVSPEILQQHGAVSAETVCAMAEGALRASGDDADVAVAVSGIAGPDGGSPTKPVGTVFIGVATRDAPAAAEHHLFPGDRTEIRLRTAEAALAMIRRRIAGAG